MIEGAFAAALDSLPSLSAAAESHIYDALTQHLGRYIHLSRDQLSVSAWEGDCVVEGIAAARAAGGARPAVARALGLCGADPRARAVARAAHRAGANPRRGPRAQRARRAARSQRGRRPGAAVDGTGRCSRHRRYRLHAEVDRRRVRRALRGAADAERRGDAGARLRAVPGRAALAPPLCALALARRALAPRHRRQLAPGLCRRQHAAARRAARPLRWLPPAAERRRRAARRPRRRRDAAAASRAAPEPEPEPAPEPPADEAAADRRAVAKSPSPVPPSPATPVAAEPAWARGGKGQWGPSPAGASASWAEAARRLWRRLPPRPRRSRRARATIRGTRSCCGAATRRCWCRRAAAARGSCGAGCRCWRCG